MKDKMQALTVGLLIWVLVGVTGCGIWPVMTEENGRRPRGMGRSDQVLWPWATQPVHLSEEYGWSYRYAVENQILDPQSINSLEVVQGIGGAAGKLSMERYQLMFKNPPFSKTVGATSTTGGGTKK